MSAMGQRQARLTLVIPTLNEVENIQPLLEALRDVLPDDGWEALFVDDDSQDGTAELIEQIAAQDPQVRLIRRIGRKGLSSACLEGFLASQAEFVGVIDADMQHDESLLPSMLEALQHQQADIVVGSRYVEGGSLGEWHLGRAWISKTATGLTRWLTGVRLSDPMSGFFMFRRSTLMPAIRKASGLGFKILLDLLLSSPHQLQVQEQPYRFRGRQAGDSKLNVRVAWQLVLLILDRKLGRLIPARFLSFGFIGMSGVAVHFAVLSLVYQLAGLSFALGQSLATLVAMTSNFLLNNLLTYGDRPLKGKALLRGWISFVVACGIGAIANIGIAEALFQQDVNWALSALAGILVGVVWNYAVTARYTWG